MLSLPAYVEDQSIDESLDQPTSPQPILARFDEWLDASLHPIPLTIR
jgi:hypothetical protein